MALSCRRGSCQATLPLPVRRICERIWYLASVQQMCAQVREYLEKNYSETSGNDTVKLALKALTETVEAGSKNIEVAVVTRDTGAQHPHSIPHLLANMLSPCELLA